MKPTILTLSEVVQSADHPQRDRVDDATLRRFFARVDRASSCWLWTGAKYRQAGKPTYGQMTYRGQRTGAHRASYLMFHGEIPDGLEVMHSCNVKACVNPAHLSVGTRGDNLRDAKRADPGLWAGERSGRAKLDWSQVREMRAMATSGIKHSDLARRFGVSAVAVSLIVRGLRWRNDPQEQEAVA